MIVQFLRNKRYRRQCRLFYESVKAFEFFIRIAKISRDIELIDFNLKQHKALCDVYFWHPLGLIEDIEHIRTLVKVNDLYRTAYKPMRSMHFLSFEERFGPPTITDAIDLWESGAPFSDDWDSWPS